jgi:hypothetical protein
MNERMKEYEAFYRHQLMNFSLDGQGKKYFVFLAVPTQSLINLFHNFQSLKIK